MIITKEFIWLHLGKTGGDKLLDIMQTYYKEKILISHHCQNPDKHLDINSKLYLQHSNKQHILNFRKLPSWIVSHNNHQLLHNKNINITHQECIEMTRAGLIISGEGKIKPDDVLMDYYNPKKDYFFIRKEFLAEDAHNILGLYYDAKSEIIEKNNVVNENRKLITVKILSEENILELYQNNPMWAYVERKIYND